MGCAMPEEGGEVGWYGLCQMKEGRWDGMGYARGGGRGMGFTRGRRGGWVVMGYTEEGEEMGWVGTPLMVYTRAGRGGAGGMGWATPEEEGGMGWATPEEEGGMGWGTPEQECGMGWATPEKEAGMGWATPY